MRASTVAERAQVCHELVDRDGSVSHVAIALLDEVRVDSDGERLLAQRDPVDLDLQEPVDRLGVPGVRVGGGLLVTASEKESRGRGAAYAGCAGSQVIEDRLGHDRTFQAAAGTGAPGRLLLASTVPSTRIPAPRAESTEARSGERIMSHIIGTARPEVQEGIHYPPLVRDEAEPEYEGPWQVAAGTPGNHRFGTVMKDLRERSDLSPQQLAEQAGVHVSFVRGIERGAQAPSVATARPLLGCMKEQDRIQWMDSGPYDLLVRDPEIGRDVAFEFKAKVKGQNRRTDLPGIAVGVSGIAEAMWRIDVDPAAMAAGLVALAEAMSRIVPPVAETGEPRADVVKHVGAEQDPWSAPGDEAAFGRVVRLLAAADQETLVRVESLLRDELKPVGRVPRRR